MQPIGEATRAEALIGRLARRTAIAFSQTLTQMKANLTHGLPRAGRRKGSILWLMAPRFSASPLRSPDLPAAPRADAARRSSRTAESRARRRKRPKAAGSREIRSAAQQFAARKPQARSLKRPLLFALLPIALVAGGYFYVTGGQIMSTDNAYVQADTVGVSTDVAGTVVAIEVHDNEVVKKGQVLYRLEARHPSRSRSTARRRSSARSTTRS